MVRDYDGNQRYLNRITSEHRIRPKFMAMNAAYLDKLQDVYELYEQMLMLGAFDLDTAVGRQLDIIGQLVGAHRVLDFNPTYADSKLDDSQYRKLIRAQISTNQWDGSMRGLMELWEGIFGAYRITILDHQDMSIMAEFHGVEDLFEAELIGKGYFAPRPEGVMVNYVFVMESVVDGEIFIVGAQVSNAVQDWLGDYAKYPVLQEGDIFVGSVHMHSIVTEPIRSIEGAPNEVSGEVCYGGLIAHEIITEQLKG